MAEQEVGDPSTSAPSRFEELMQMLGQEHENEVKRLRSEIDSLHSSAPMPAQTHPIEENMPCKLASPEITFDQEILAQEPTEAHQTLPKESSVREPAPLHVPEGVAQESLAVRVDSKSSSCDSYVVISDAAPTTESPSRCPFKLKLEWEADPPGADHWADMDHSLTHYARISSRFGNFQRKSKQLESLEALTHKSCVISPMHPLRMWWDFAGLILIAYDMVTIPIFLAFEPEDLIFTDFMAWLVLFFWTLDMIASMCTGYYKDGVLIMSSRRICKNYLKGWFWADCLVVIPDWVMKVMGTMTNVAGLGRFLRTIRIMRVLRMLRLVKLNRLMGMIYDMIDSEHMFIMVDLVKMLCIILFLNHMVACIWYFIGRVSKEASAPKNWLQDVGMTPVWEQDMAWKYLTSLHWSITQFTPASMDVSATNVPERLFSVVVLFWALIALSSIIGNVTASVSALRNMSLKEAKEFWLLRKYLKQRGVSNSLIDRIVKFSEFRCQKNNHMVVPDTVVLLRRITSQLQSELSHEMNSPILELHVFFERVGSDYPTLTFRLCHLALCQSGMAKFDALFEPGLQSSAMYFVKSGRLQLRDSTGRPAECFLQNPGWASEPTLWTFWVHRGYLIADVESEVLGLFPDKFSEVMRSHPGTWQISKSYGSAYIKQLNCLPRSELHDVMFTKDVAHVAIEQTVTGGTVGSASGYACAENDENRNGTSVDDNFLS